MTYIIDNYWLNFLDSNNVGKYEKKVMGDLLIGQTIIDEYYNRPGIMKPKRFYWLIEKYCDLRNFLAVEVPSRGGERYPEHKAFMFYDLNVWYKWEFNIHDVTNKI